MGGFTQRQVEWIRRRDEFTCQFPDTHDCYGKPECHHVQPQGWSGVVLGLKEKDYNIPENGIMVCKNSHQEYINPDTAKALADYRMGNKQAFKQLIEYRIQLCQKGVKYWCDVWDEQMKEIAQQRTKDFRSRGEIFPLKNGAWRGHF